MVDADCDIAEQRFLVEHEKILLTYHRKAKFITSSSRNFEKPDNADDKQWNVTFKEALHSAFGASNGTEKSEPVERQLPVYQELVRALKAEAKAIRATRNTQAFINEILEVSLRS